MGPSLDLLLSICNGKFDFYTVIYIGIDVIKNLEILHNRGFIHRDLKPNNLAFGCLNLNYRKYKTDIGILDFGSSGSIIKQNVFTIEKKRKNCIYGKKIYTSNNVLKGKLFNKIDDVISLFYILVKLKTGTLPWMECSNEKKINEIERIIQIREQNPPIILCKEFPQEFINLFEKVLNTSQDETPKYNDIIISFEKMKEKYIYSNGDFGYKFQWIKIFIEHLSRSEKLLCEYSKENLKYFISDFGLNFKKYTNFLIN